jgi:hypothetical protein
MPGDSPERDQRKAQTERKWQPSRYAEDGVWPAIATARTEARRRAADDGDAMPPAGEFGGDARDVRRRAADVGGKEVGDEKDPDGGPIAALGPALHSRPSHSDWRYSRLPPR